MSSLISLTHKSRLLLNQALRWFAIPSQETVTSKFTSTARLRQSINYYSSQSDDSKHGSSQLGPKKASRNTKEEEYFKSKQTDQLDKIRSMLDRMKEGKIEYHQKQLDRHVRKMKKHEDLMAQDNDPQHKIYIDSHKEAADAHQFYLDKLNELDIKL